MDANIPSPAASSPGIQLVKPHERFRSQSLNTTLESLTGPRRSSSRNIKRKRFDDEIVESSLGVHNAPQYKYARIRNLSLPNSTVGSSPSTSSETQIPVPPEPKKRSKSSSKRSRRGRNSQSVATKDLGRWKPTDDLALITAVQQTNDLTTVWRGIKFSCKFTLAEVQERWYALLYDTNTSRLSVAAMKNLHPEVIFQVQSKTLYSKKEEELLGNIKSTTHPTVEVFQTLLDQNPDLFHPSRTAKSLMQQWTLRKQYHLLPDQTAQPYVKNDQVLQFSDAEDLINDAELLDPRDEVIEQEMNIADRRLKKEIRHLEDEVTKLEVLVDSVVGISPPDFDNQTLAVLRGRLVRYLMRSREISVGRSTKDSTVDVDLSLEGPAWKVSRRQGIIKLKNNGDFFIANEGKRPIYVDGRAVLNGSKWKLNNNSVVEISGLRFIFHINQDLINVIRQEAAKLNTS